MRCVIYLCATIPALTFSLTWYYGNWSLDFVPKCKKADSGEISSSFEFGQSFASFSPKFCLDSSSTNVYIVEQAPVNFDNGENGGLLGNRLRFKE